VAAVSFTAAGAPMTSKFLAFYVLVVGAGLTLLTHGLFGLQGCPWILLAFWTLLILAVDAAPVQLPGGGFITVSSTVDYAGILILGPVPTALAEFVATLVLQVGVQRRPLPKAFFNASLFAGTVIVAGSVFRVLGGNPGAAPVFPDVLLPLAGMGVAYYALNSGLVSLVLALSEGRNAWHIWQVNYIWTVFHMVASLPFAAAIAVGYAGLGNWGVVLFVIPLLLARYSFKLYIDTKKDLLDFATVLAGVIDEIDPYTRKHSQRVSRYAAKIARELGLVERDVERVEYAGLLHDIGKIKTDHRELLFKAGRLSPEERRRMDDHAAFGADILEHVRAFRDVAPIVRHHHERPDGTGYPDGLEAAEIPVGSRIVLVADAFDAMTSDRVYRRALTVKVALGELHRYAGRQFDATVVAALQRLLATGEIRVTGGDTAPDPGALSRPDLVNAGLAKTST